ncbi:uncharacterized protein LOC130647782 isoform X2 [Hydractinia symbiolongicarpus]|uniref:uncharacterized protein LOC130647782 isoform X2 n=1 Tax=Hydractinia symbiolongicarpus TaxID=13093 RepID=UPI00254A2C99|nr:uncharacterized protein LOC130647782 isoform X2 [Hydractinia symbiolongicarpus]
MLTKAILVLKMVMCGQCCEPICTPCVFTRHQNKKRRENSNFEFINHRPCGQLHFMTSIMDFKAAFNFHHIEKRGQPFKGNMNLSDSEDFQTQKVYPNCRQYFLT